jgi:hypothetical protein
MDKPPRQQQPGDEANVHVVNPIGARGQVVGGLAVSHLALVAKLGIDGRQHWRRVEGGCDSWGLFSCWDLGRRGDGGHRFSLLFLG